MTLTFPVTWRHQSSDHLIPQVPFRVLCPIVTESVSPAIFEIMGPKDIEVTNLTFQGHVMSSITWPIDSPYAIFYCYPIKTEALFNRFRDIRPQVPCAHTPWFTDTQTHAASDLYSVPCSIFYWTDKNQKKLAPKSTLRTQTTYVVPVKLQASQTTPLGYACIRWQTTRLRNMNRTTRI